MTERNLFYTSQRSEWRAWLQENFKTAREVWFVFPLLSSGEKCLAYNDAVEEALCFGWIDGQADKLDEFHQIRRFTPRRKNSPYSQLNTERLIWLYEHDMIHPDCVNEVREIILSPFVYPSDIIDAIMADEKAWQNFSCFPESYRRIRIAHIEAARKNPEEFRKRLEYFIRKTNEGRRIMGYGSPEKYYGSEDIL